MAYNSPDNLASDCIFHHFVPSPPWVTLIISCPTYSCLRTFELAIPSAWKWLRWLRICLQGGKPRFDPWVRRIPWRREWLPIPVFVPGEFHGQMSMVGYSPQSGKEWVTTEANNTFPFTADCRRENWFRPTLLTVVCVPTILVTSSSGALKWNWFIPDPQGSFTKRLLIWATTVCTCECLNLNADVCVCPWQWTTFCMSLSLYF